MTNGKGGSEGLGDDVSIRDRGPTKAFQPTRKEKRAAEG